MGLKLTQKTVIADASSGRLTAADGDVATAAYSPEPDADIKILPVSMSHKTAHALAEAYAVPDEAKGWKRGFRTSTLLLFFSVTLFADHIQSWHIAFFSFL